MPYNNSSVTHVDLIIQQLKALVTEALPTGFHGLEWNVQVGYTHRGGYGASV